MNFVVLDITSNDVWVRVKCGLHANSHTSSLLNKSFVCSTDSQYFFIALCLEI